MSGGRGRQRGVQQQRVLEKTEQAHTIKLLMLLGTVYVIGTRRSRGRGCPQCGVFVAEHQGTRQTPGIADLLVFLKDPAPGRGQCSTQRTRRLVFIEQKAIGGRMSPEQREFRELCLAAATDHVVGTYDTVIAWLVQEGYVRADSVPHYRLT